MTARILKPLHMDACAADDTRLTDRSNIVEMAGSGGSNLFVVHWTDRSLNADAYVRFATDYSGQVAGFTMQAVSATTDFSFDFQDLDFSRVR